MKKFIIFIFVMFLTACVTRGSLKLPEFSVFWFTGNAYSDGMPIPLQGALTKNESELKFVLAARQGVVLGYGIINADTGKVNLSFSQSPGVKRLLNSVGEALMELLPAIQEHRRVSAHWSIENDEKMVYKTYTLDLSGQLKRAMP